MTRLEGCTALVTGAAAGIGQAVVHDFVQAGARVLAVDLDVEALESLERELGDDQVLAHPADVTDLAAMQDAVAVGTAQFGDISIVASVAGISGRGAVADMPHPDRDRIMEVNFEGTWNTFQAALPSVRRADRPGRLIACGSVESVLGTAHLSAYVASKHAVLGLVKSLALELAEEGISVNAVSPAGVRTGMMDRLLRPEEIDHVAATTPVKRLCTPSEMATFFTFVAGEASSYMTGENLVVDGGVKVVNSHTFQGFA